MIELALRYSLYGAITLLVIYMLIDVFNIRLPQIRKGSLYNCGTTVAYMDRKWQIERVVGSGDGFYYTLIGVDNTNIVRDVNERDIEEWIE